jgi:hypothetical protein
LVSSFRANCYYCCEEEYSGQKKAGVSPCSVIVLSLVIAGFLKVGYRNKAYTVLVLPESTEAHLGSTLSRRRSAPIERTEQKHGGRGENVGSAPVVWSLLHRLAHNPARVLKKKVRIQMPVFLLIKKRA